MLSTRTIYVDDDNHVLEVMVDFTSGLVTVTIDTTEDEEDPKESSTMSVPLEIWNQL